MNAMLRRAILATSAIVVAPPPSPLSYISANVTTGSTTVSSIDTSAAISPAANAIVAVGFAHRGGTSERTHNAPTAGFATVAGFSEVVTALAPQASDGQTNHGRVTWWTATTTSSPGSGTITCSASGTTFQQLIWVVVIENATSLSASGSAVTAGASSLTATFSPSVGSGYQLWLGLHYLNGAAVGSWSGGLSGVAHAAASPYELSGRISIGAGIGSSPSNSNFTLGGTTNTRQAAMAVLAFEGPAP